MGHGQQRTQNVGKPANQGQVMGEMGRERKKFVGTPGKRQVTIFKGPRDNYEETSQVYLDEDGPIGGEIVHETANRVIVEYDEATYLANKAKYEAMANRRVSTVAPVDGAGITSNTVRTGEEKTLASLMADAEADAAQNAIRAASDARLAGTFDQ